jgi:hypothetical protein
MLGGLLTELWEFIKAVVTYWQALATGGLIAFGLFLIERLASWSMPKKAFMWVFVVAFLVVASFLAWRDQRREVATLRAAQDARTRPIIRAQIEQAVLNTEHEPGTLHVLLTASVRNVGAPTALEDWQLEVTPAGGAPVRGRPQVIPGSMTICGKRGRGLLFTDRDALYHRTLARPIETGGMVRGVLGFKFPGMSEARFYQPTTRLKLQARDVLGTPHVVEQGVPGEGSELAYDPGAVRVVPCDVTRP